MLAIELIDGLPVAELAKRIGISVSPFVKFLNANAAKLEQKGRKFTGNSELDTELLELICLEKDINADVLCVNSHLPTPLSPRTDRDAE